MPGQSEVGTRALDRPVVEIADLFNSSAVNGLQFDPLYDHQLAGQDVSVDCPVAYQDVQPPAGLPSRRYVRKALEES
jgi:hypothetical protein